ncbi:MAG: ExeM/NucH family extracellular endonuclease [Rhizobacter sp.]
MGAALGVPALASTSGVVISQVYGGNGNVYASDYVELFNAGTAPVSIAGWSVQYSSAAGTGLFSGNGVAALSGTLQPGQRYLVQLATTTGTALPTPDAIGTTNMSGTAGKVIIANVNTGLACNGASTPCNATQLAQIVDLVGFGGTANFFEGSAPASAPSATTALIRNLGGCTDTGNNGADFTVGTPAPRNSTAALTPCGGPPPTGAIVPSCPASVAIATGASVDTTLSATDTDSIVNSAAFVSGNVSGMSLTAFTAAPAIGGSASVKLSVDGTVIAGTYPVVVGFGNNDAQSASCSVSVTVSAVGGYTPIYDIQGSGTTSTLLGVRTTRGVVTKVNNNGYFLQDPVGDGNPLTSDGIFVFTSTAPTVSVGQQVQITGTVSEFNTGAATNAETLARTVTEFSNLTATTVLGTGSVTPTVISFPVGSQGDLERYEGMLVQINVPLTASQNYFQGRYGQVTLSANGRLIKPNNVYRPNDPLRASLQDLNARSSLMLDDGTSLQNPNPTPYIGADNTLRAGDTLLSGIVGVIDYGLATSDNTGLAMYRIHPTQAPVFARSNPRTSAPPAVGGNVKVASFNVLNFFTTFTDGTTATGGTGQGCSLGGAVSAANCRGADNLGEFTRQRAKIVQAMAAIQADVFGLMEIQNNGNVAAQNLVDALNAVVGANTYAVVPTPPTTGTDAIRVAMIYKPATLALSGASLSDGSAIHNRPPFAQAFTAGGQKFSVVVNHFKSKGSCPGDSSLDDDQGDGQGCWNARRKLQAQALVTFIGTVQASAADNDVMVIGDLNAYGAEDPIDVLTSAGLVNQISRFDAAGYSYVFDGEAGYLDHALATSSLSSQIAGTTHWHINADEPSIIDYNAEFKQPACATCGPDYYSATPFRASDHDPVVIGISLAAPTASQTISFTAPADRAVNSGTFIVTATATSGLAVTFSSVTASVCTVTSGGSVSLVAVGTCTLAADQAGNASFAPAPQVLRSFAVGAATGQAQTIGFGTLASRAVDSGNFIVGATASSGLSVVFSSLTSSICTVVGNTVTLLTVGTCTIVADQAGNASYAAAPQVAQSFSVTAAGGGGGGDADIPTLPEWGAILLGMLLLTLGMRRSNNLNTGRTL